MNIIQKGRLPALLLALVLLAGCAPSKPAYPVIEPMDTRDKTLETTQDTKLRFSYPAEEWIAAEGAEPASVAYAETYGTERTVNVNAQVSSGYSGALKESDLEGLLDAFDELGGYMAPTLAELRSQNGESVIYTETSIVYTDELLDLMVEKGALTEEWPDANGGRQILLDLPETDQISMYAVVDGHLCVYVGTYYDTAQKQPLIDVMTVMIGTTEVL